MGKVRLQKYLAEAGIDSRRKCEELILDGVVRVNRKVVDELPVFVDPEVDVISVNGKIVREAKKVYFLLNKPKGVICTNSDPQGRKKAIDLIDTPERIFCVGRLDADSTGGIILTNDSELSNLLTHPRYELPKTYQARVKGKMTGEAVEKLKKGMWLAEGRTNRSMVKILRRGNMESMLEITIKQGRKRQIRRMVAKTGFKVKGLKRTQIGALEIKGVGVGNYRKLTGREIGYLKKTTAGKKTK